MGPRPWLLAFCAASCTIGASVAVSWECYRCNHKSITVADAIRILRESNDEQLRAGAVFSLSQVMFDVIEELQRQERNGDLLAKALLDRLRAVIR